jgi:STE24 endopeptidase
VAYGLALYFLGWGWMIQDTFTWGPKTAADELQPMIPGTELFIMAPFLVAVVASWACFYDVEGALHNAAVGAASGNQYWSRWAYLAFQIRQRFGFVCVPLLLLILVKDLPQLLPDWLDESLLTGSTLLIRAVAPVFVTMPWIVRVALGWKSMPEGPLRRRLLASAQRLQFRCTDLLVWNTRGGVANAMVVGILPLLRYVVFTDRLLSDMTEDEVEAVFGHEVGHIKHRHIPYYLIFLDRPGWLQSWQHSTIARRVEFLERCLADPGEEPRFQRHVGWVKLVSFLVLGAVLLVMGKSWGWASLLSF